MITKKIWDNFSLQLLGFIKSRVHNNVVAEDILQDVFIKIHLKKDLLKENDKITSWVYQITRNSIIDYYRKVKPEKSEIDSNIIMQEDNENTPDFSV
ncbi:MULTISPECIES: sigma factor [unclassified Saccharicrinis]|uniref:sigma factor n=1 Tax=unclassified Saccharicrinis TaxID=2646859 RepID=UPI003D329488